MTTAREHNRAKQNSWVGELGIEVVSAEPGTVVGQIQVRPEFLAPNGFIHAAVLVSFADSLCGSGTVEALPQGATGHTTIELKANLLGTVREGLFGKPSRCSGARSWSCTPPPDEERSSQPAGLGFSLSLRRRNFDAQ